MEPDYDFEAELIDTTNSMQLVIDEVVQSGRRDDSYIEGFSRTLINQIVQVLIARGFERNQISYIVNDEASS